MKYKLTKTEYDGLSEDAKKEYTLDGDNAILNIEGDDAPTQAKIDAVEAKRQIEIEHRKNAETKVAEADKRAEQLEKDLENAGGDKKAIETLRAEHTKQLETLRAERAEEQKAIAQERNNAMIQDEARNFATKHFVDTPFGAQFITSKVAERLTVEEVAGTPVVRVVNPDGTPSTASLSDLQKEFLDNKEFSPIIKANVGSGGGATQNIGGGAARKSLSEMTATEEAAFERDNPTEYAAAIAESQ